MLLWEQEPQKMLGAKKGGVGRMGRGGGTIQELLAGGQGGGGLGLSTGRQNMQIRLCMEAEGEGGGGGKRSVSNKSCAGVVRSVYQGPGGKWEGEGWGGWEVKVSH